jgi:hypothetical protein
MQTSEHALEFESLLVHRDRVSPRLVVGLGWRWTLVVAFRCQEVMLTVLKRTTTVEMSHPPLMIPDTGICASED